MERIALMVFYWSRAPAREQAEQEREREVGGAGHGVRDAPRYAGPDSWRNKHVQHYLGGRSNRPNR